MAWDDDLDQQSVAYRFAASPEIRIRVLAGPGTGKSFAMKRRVARLLEGGVQPESILAATFTRVGAEDLHRELVSLNVAGANALSGRTLHSVAMSLLMRNHVLGALQRTPRPLNEFEQEPLIQDLGPRHGNKRARRRLIRAYEAAWARLQHEEPGHAQNPNDQAFRDDLLAWLQLHRAMLIGEVIPHLYQYLRSNPAAPEHTEFTHCLVDEYQDLNRVEQEVLAMLSEAGSICVVGDDDQSIYSFKHADPAGIRQWSDIHGGENFAVEECRRCPTMVVRMANNLIARNSERLPRALRERVENGLGEVVIRQYQSVDNEANAVATKIQALVNHGVLPGEIIVLAQRETLGTPVFERLRAMNIPVKSYYAEAALDTVSAQERFAILKLYLDSEDRVALRWLLGCYHDQWHSSAYRRVLDHVALTGKSPWTILVELSEGSLRLRHVNNLVARFREIYAEVERLRSLPDLGSFLQHWLANPESVPLLAEAAHRCAKDAETVEELFAGLYAEITQPEIPLEVAEVRVMSLHKSKGLSSPYVFIIGCVEGLHPSQPGADIARNEAEAKLEEDRRLFYVGITRVKAEPGRGRQGYLALTYSQTMPIADALASQIAPVGSRRGIAILQASRFIGEFGPETPRPRANMPL